MDEGHAESSIGRETAGFCANCSNMRIVESSRGSEFVFCELSLGDQRFTASPFAGVDLRWTSGELVYCDQRELRKNGIPGKRRSTEVRIIENLCGETGTRQPYI
jgi:hypothetical protein